MKTLVINLSLTLSILFMVSAAVIAQSPKPFDRATLRAKFVAAFGNDFDLVKDEMKVRSVASGGGTFWLAYVKPKRTGHFYLQYRYLERWPLKIREHELRVNIGPEKCRRGTPQSGVYTRFCLNDTLIVPVLVNNYPGHEFKLTKAEYTNQTEEPREAPAGSRSLIKSQISNPAAPILNYEGRAAHKMYHRIPGYTMHLYAEFMAERPGRMNLLLTTSDPGSADLRGYEGVPIIVLPLGAPATLIAGREETRGYIRNRDGGESLFSTSGNSYMSSVMILQPGDRVSVTYFRVVRSSDYVKGRFGVDEVDPSQNLEPVITVRSFAPDTKYNFTEWVVDYLPK